MKKPCGEPGCMCHVDTSTLQLSDERAGVVRAETPTGEVFWLRREGTRNGEPFYAQTTKPAWWDS